MTDITERLRELSKARWDKDAWERETTVRIPAEPDRDIDLVLANAAAEIDRLRARVAELEAERAEDLCADVYEQITAMIEPHVVREGKSGGFLPGSVVESFQMLLEYRLAEAAKGEPVAFLHQVVCGDGEPDQALSFAPDNFPLAGVLGYRSLSHVPLYTAPRVDVDAISDEALMRVCDLIFRQAEREPSDIDDMRAALRAIFNKGE